MKPTTFSGCPPVGGWPEKAREGSLPRPLTSMDSVSTNGGEEECSKWAKWC